MHATLEMIFETRADIEQQAWNLAGGLKDLSQRAITYHRIYRDSGRNHVFPLIAAHGALWAGGYFRFGMKLGCWLSWLSPLDAALRQRRVSALAEFADAFREINRLVCVDTWVKYTLTDRFYGNDLLSEVIPADLLLALERVHAARRRGWELSNSEKREVFRAHFLNEQRTVVTPRIQAAMDKLDWPLMKAIAVRPRIRFAYFSRARWMRFRDFTNLEERIQRGMSAFDAATEQGWDRVEAALENYGILPAEFVEGCESHFSRLQGCAVVSDLSAHASTSPPCGVDCVRMRRFRELTGLVPEMHSVRQPAEVQSLHDSRKDVRVGLSGKSMESVPKFAMHPLHLRLAIVLLGTAFPVTLPAAEPVESSTSLVSPVAPGGAADNPLQRPTKGGTKRVLVVTAPECVACEAALKDLQKSGGPFDQLRSRGWKIGTGPENHIQLVNQSGSVDSDIAAVVASLKPSGGPVVLCVENGEIERSFKSGCTTPLDQWTFGWLMTGEDLRPADSKPLTAEVPTSGHYKLRGNHWSVSGNWNPTHPQVLQHLRSEHANALKPEWSLESWSIEELRSLHDDVHEREEGVRGRVSSAGVAKSPSKDHVGFRKPGNPAK